MSSFATFESDAFDPDAFQENVGTGGGGGTPSPYYPKRATIHEPNRVEISGRVVVRMVGTASATVRRGLAGRASIRSHVMAQAHARVALAGEVRIRAKATNSALRHRTRDEKDLLLLLGA